METVPTLARILFLTPFAMVTVKYLLVTALIIA
jgi:hypothetical protein